MVKEMQPDETCDEHGLLNAFAELQDLLNIDVLDDFVEVCISEVALVIVFLPK